ncbi:PilZ domain-containing protein [Roseibium sp. MMSF_3544]|uniref:PilZ domain-containing protein n=1 Tax=unclassified Roseibium TaxID=2629323 RepID=UPI002740085A|nr:PilZ domain-containing protein [Roseibium sp. MMSF_3544]
MSNVDPAPQQNADPQEAEDFVPRARRARVYKKGKMVFQNGLRSIPCVVRNISDGGAMLEFEQPYILPKDFELYIDLEDYEVSCERRWEEGLKCGVMFTSSKRHVSQQRAQVLKSSETALQARLDPAWGDLEKPLEAEEHEQEPDASEDTGRRNTPPAGGKPAFGKRR